MTIPIVPTYYCSNKFTFLKVDLEKQATLNCHAAAENRIDLGWLKNNPGQLFNTSTNIRERQQMLNGERNSSCEKNCYPAEDRGEVSTRMLENDNSFHDLYTTPKTLDITLGSDCNMACSYCCKEYSSAWQRDLKTHGPYVVDQFLEPERYSFTTKDQIVSRLSQSQILSSDSVKLLLDEIGSLRPERAIITGGEPMLNKYLLDIVEKLTHVPDVKIFSGLGVNSSRLSNIIKSLNQFPNVRLCISGENMGDLHEFNRNGSSWETWNQNLQTLLDLNARVSIHSSISNLTIFGFADFYKKFNRLIPIEIDVVHSPNFMSMTNIDHASKNNIIEQLRTFDNSAIQKIVVSLTKSTDFELGRKQLAQWLTQYVQRRNLSIDVFPQTFTQWLNK